MEYDFSGWATRNDIKCSDGRTIKQNAFADCDGKKVPLVWMHQHNDPNNVLGHAYLENRDDGVYTYGKFNNTEAGRNAKIMVTNGDVDALSIYANQLKHDGGNVLHGNIREVSLVLAGANPGAFIDSVIVHGEESDEEAIIYSDIAIQHGENTEQPEPKKGDENMGEEKKPNDERTVKDIFETLTDEQKNVVYFMIGQALEEAKGDQGGSVEHEDYDEDFYEGDEMKHNVFENDEQNYNASESILNDFMAHADMGVILNDAKRCGSFKDAVLMHAEGYGIDHIDYLFPDYKTLDNPPTFIKRPDAWVGKVMGGVKHIPFARIKSMQADITADEARAKGYTKGKKKLEEVFTLLKRTTDPQTVYKKQKLDRDDMIDITDFNVVAWLKTEMRMMLDEELARAVLIGDGRSTMAEDKIQEAHIRPIATDDVLYSIKAQVKTATEATSAEVAQEFIRTVIKSRKDYRGSGNPTLYTTEDLLTEMLMLTDKNGRDLYDSESKLATKLRVKEIVTIPVMDNAQIEDGGKKPLLGIIVNLADYAIGADKGGAVGMFDDFDIDFNQYKYLIETRCSGALTTPKSAIVLDLVKAGPEVVSETHNA